MTALDPSVLVGLGGALGAVARHAVGSMVDADSFPVGTLTVNVLGTFVLALVAFGDAGGEVALFVGTGACGAFTTFSSFSFETVGLYERGYPRRAVANAVGNLVGAGVGIGVALGILAVV
jgi:CrcB protein